MRKRLTRNQVIAFHKSMNADDNIINNIVNKITDFIIDTYNYIEDFIYYNHVWDIWETIKRKLNNKK